VDDDARHKELDLLTHGGAVVGALDLFYPPLHPGQRRADIREVGFLGGCHLDANA